MSKHRRLLRSSKTTAATGGCTPAPSDHITSDLFTEAIRLVQTGADDDHVTILFRAIAILDPSRAGIWGQFSTASTRGAQRKLGELPSTHATTSRAVLLQSLFDRAVRQHHAGGLDDAEGLYRAILALAPQQHMVWSNLGALLLALGRSEESLMASSRAVAIAPGYADAHLNRAGALEHLGRLDDAVESYTRGFALSPNRIEVLRKIGAVCETACRMVEAVDAYQRLIDAVPSDVDGHFRLAELHKKLGRFKEAEAAYRRTIELKPDHAAAYSNLGAMIGLNGLGDDPAEAEQLCLRAVALVPDNAESFNNLGAVLQTRGKLDEALAAYQRALAIKPELLVALANSCAVLQVQSRFDEVAPLLEHLTAADPHRVSAHVQAITVRRQICDWRHFEADRQMLHDMLERRVEDSFIYALLTFSPSAGAQLAAARLIMARYDKPTFEIGRRVARQPKTTLRIGYLSADYREHPVGRLVPDLFEHHDRRGFEVIGYSLGSDDVASPTRRRIKAACDRFVDLDPIPTLEACRRIVEDEIDILVDLSGPTSGARFDILASRPAPIQVSFLGWPGTLGTNCLDYLIADPFLIPPDHHRFYHEKIVSMPLCYQPSDSRRVVGRPPSRAACRLPETGFVFCSFNNAVKITPETFATWMRILLRVEDSVLWLYCKTPRTIENLSACATAAGVSSDRIVFASTVGADDYMARFACADLFLDTHPYTAGSTANDALWAGLPVLTCVGQTYVSRMAGSLLNTLGAQELIASDLQAYEDKAVEFAKRPRELAAIRDALERGRDNSGLFDTPRYAAALETAFREMHDTWCEGHSPASFDVASLVGSKRRSVNET